MLKEQGFNEWANKYDKQVLESNGYPFEGYKKLLDFYLTTVKTEKEPKILDVGIGTGLLSSILSDKGASIIGLDFSQKMIEIAKKRINTGRFYQQDLTNGLPQELENEKFDTIISNYVFHHFDLTKKIALILQLKQKLLPGGKIFIGDVSFLTKKDLLACKNKYHDLWDEDEIYHIKEEIEPELKNLI